MGSHYNRGMDQSAAIGVFDSGVGGLTVLAALRDAFPHERFVYLGDTARVPYGTRSAHTIKRYALNNARTLLEADSLKLLVVACNTVSAVALETLEQAFSLPVVGVIDPGAEAAAAASQGGGVHVLATRGTVSSNAYVRALADAGYKGAVSQKACPLFVSLAEEGWTTGDIAERTAQKYLSDIPKDADTVVLGCTHFPLLKAAVQNAVGDRRVVDGGEATARAVRRVLDAQNGHAPSGAQELQLMVTDAPDDVFRLAPLFLGVAVLREQIRLVDVEMSAKVPA